MAYDNDLSPLAEPILDMIAEGSTGAQVVVTVHIDRRGPGGMERVVLSDSSWQSTPLPNQEGSADLAWLAKELHWVSENHPAHRYAVVFLGHGGKLGEMSFDETQAEAWLDPRHVAQTLALWDQQTPGDLDLVFLQQCGKSNLETLHAFGAVADVVVASEAIIGAPNFYYSQALQQLNADPTQDAQTLGRALVSGDRPDMYRTYTVARASGLIDLPGQLDRVLAPLISQGAGLVWNGGPEPTHTYRGERYLDLLGLLGLLYTENELDPTLLDAFESWWESEVMSLHQVSPLHPRDATRLSGATVLLPSSPGGWRSYADFPLYQSSDLPLLLDMLLR
jgi:hypothetical protein